MANSSSVMVISQKNRVETAVKVQDVLTKYGCYIRVRLGLHEANIDGCSNSGMILLHLSGEDTVISELEQEIKAISDVKVKYMILDF